MVREDVWNRTKTKFFARDLTQNERESYKFIKEHAASLAIRKEDLKTPLTTVLERGPFNYPLTLFRRLGVCLRGFQGIADAIISAVGRQRLVLRVRGLSAMLAVIEVFLDYHWRVTRMPALVQDLALDGASQLTLRQVTTELLSPTVSWQDILACVFLDYLRVMPLSLEGEGKGYRFKG